MNEETYLGDAVFASWDGWMIKLRCEAPSEAQAIFLEPAVMMELIEFAKKHGVVL